MSEVPSLNVLTDPPPLEADERIPYGGEPLQFGDLRLPAGPGPHPLAVVIHGGYWQAIYNLIHTGHLCVDLAANGIATWNVEYRRIGDPGGLWPAPLDDVVLALDHVRELARSRPLDLGRVVVVGHSAGGQLALLGAVRSAVRPRGVVSLAGVVDPHETDRRGDDHGLLRRLLGGTPGEEPKRWAEASPRAQLPLGLPYVLACGTKDVHWEPNLSFAEAAREAGDEVKLLPLEGAGHFELVDPAAREWDAIRTAIAVFAAL